MNTNHTTETPARETYLTSRFADERHAWGLTPQTCENLMLGALENGYHAGLTLILTP